MSTIHNPKNFIPENYAPTAYLDNKAPEANEFFALMRADQAAAMLAAAREQFNARFAEFFGWKEQGKLANVPHRCVHCGAGIRYVVAVKYAPTGEYVPFGSDCAERCELSLDQHQLKNLKEVAAKRNATIKLGGKYNAFMAANADFAELVAKYKDSGAHNDFIDDVLWKLRQYGDLSVAQREAVEKSITRTMQYAEERKARQEAEKAAHAAMLAEGKVMAEGRRQIAGEVLSVKLQDSFYGSTLKMLVQDDDGFKYWGSVPAAINVERGTRVVMVATVTKSDKDEFFGFFKRPAKAVVVAAS